MDPRQTGAAFFVIADTDSMTEESVPNEIRDIPAGADVETAKAISRMGVQALISDQISPDALRTLQDANIKIYPYSGGLVRDAIYQLRNGELRTLQELAAQTPAEAAARAQAGPGRGMGSGGPQVPGQKG
ncbi:MAG TPA: NifB/NifX family molybdenum-iron cluster-binding protein [Methanotrichaceae archaeon]|nr:NifB/NifX family molybdenum-iron cluster-binding protein [Methanotrichaceae archaeon]